MTGFVWMVANQFPLNELLLKRLQEMGISGFRCGGDARIEVNPRPGVFDFTSIDESVETALAHGAVNANVGYIPDHAVGGLPTYGGIVGHGCIEFIRPDGGLGADNLRYSTADHCVNPPLNIDRQTMFAQGAAFAGRPWASKVGWVGIGNEPDDPNFPTEHLIARDWGGSWDVAAQHAFLFIFRPFIEGWKSVLPETKVLGFDCATSGYNGSMAAAQERDLLKDSPLLGTDANVRMIHDAWTPTPPSCKIDMNGFHCYAGAGQFPLDAQDRLFGFGGYVPFLKEQGWYGRVPMACAEVDLEHGEDPRTIPQFIAAMWAMHALEFVTLYSPRHYFGDGTEQGLKMQLAAGRCEPNSLYGEVQKTISQITSRQR